MDSGLESGPVSKEVLWLKGLRWQMLPTLDLDPGGLG